MSFKKVRRPDKAKFIDPGLPMAGVSEVPEVPFFSQEAAYWINQAKSPNEGWANFAGNVARDTRRLVRDSIELRQHPQLLTLAGMVAASKWILGASGLVAWSRMWRESGIEPGKAFSSELHAETRLPAIMLDVDVNCIPLSGMHLNAESLAETYGIEGIRKGTTLWLEGEAVYLRVSSPACPTPAIKELFAEEGMQFPTDTMTSIVPRLKTEIWPTTIIDSH